MIEEIDNLLKIHLGEVGAVADVWKVTMLKWLTFDMSIVRDHSCLVSYLLPFSGCGTLPIFKLRFCCISCSMIDIRTCSITYYSSTPDTAEYCLTIFSNSSSSCYVLPASCIAIKFCITCSYTDCFSLICSSMSSLTFCFFSRIAANCWLVFWIRSF